MARPQNEQATDQYNKFMVVDFCFTKFLRDLFGYYHLGKNKGKKFINYKLVILYNLGVHILIKIYITNL